MLRCGRALRPPPEAVRDDSYRGRSFSRTAQYNGSQKRPVDQPLSKEQPGAAFLMAEKKRLRTNFRQEKPQRVCSRSRRT
ncbi:hypothetical protein MTO96_027178 [Rhipicephalus appendiculatus]